MMPSRWRARRRTSRWCSARPCSLSRCTHPPRIRVFTGTGTYRWEIHHPSMLLDLCGWTPRDFIFHIRFRIRGLYRCNTRWTPRQRISTPRRRLFPTSSSIPPIPSLVSSMEVGAHSRLWPPRDPPSPPTVGTCFGFHCRHLPRGAHRRPAAARRYHEGGEERGPDPLTWLSLPPTGSATTSR